jgi:glycerophosphoryl diester phosphodiesterase
MPHPLLSLTARPVVGHRGNRAYAPENTLESFRQAIEVGVDAIELDVHLSADGQVIVMHDSTVDRTTNGTGAVERLSLEELRALDAGARFTANGDRSYPYRDRGIRVPTFAEVLEAFPTTPLLFEIKALRAAVPALELIQRHRAEDRCIAGSFLLEALLPFRGSRIAFGASSPEVARLLWPAVFRRRRAFLEYHVACVPRWYRGIPLPIRGMAAVMAGAGRPLHVWTVNERAVAARLWRDGVRGIITDDPATILAERG